MPQIPLNIGPMDMESDPSSKKDGVLAHLINGYTVGTAVHAWPGMVEHHDFGSGTDVWLYYSRVHSTTLAVTAGKLYLVTGETHTEITGASLTAGVPPTFTEDAAHIFIAADSQINTYTPGSMTVTTPRSSIDPVYSAVLAVTTGLPSFTLTNLAVESTSLNGAIVRYSLLDVDSTHFQLQTSVNGLAWVTVSADEAPGENKTCAITGLTLPMTYAVRLRFVPINSDLSSVASPTLLIVNGTNSAPVFITQPIATAITDTTATLSYGTADDESNNYDLSLSTDNGATWTVVTSGESPGDNKTYTVTGLTPGTEHKVALQLKSTTANRTEITSKVVRVSTPPTSYTNDAGSPLTFSTPLSSSEISSTGVRLSYTTADSRGYHYEIDKSMDGGNSFVAQSLDEAPGAGSILVSGLDYDTAYYFQVKLISQDNQAPIHVTSLAWMAGFLIANGQAQEGALPGDFGYSDNENYTRWSFENNATSPDPLQAMVATPNGELFCIGTQSVDINTLSGDVSNPFAANRGAAHAYGTLAPYSVAYDQQSVYFLSTIGGNTQVVRLVGGREAQVITFPVSVPIGEVRDVTTARAALVGFKGQNFYLITFPDADITIDDELFTSLTFAFNIRAERWHILADWQSPGWTLPRGVSYIVSDKLYIGGKDGKIYTLGEADREDEPLFSHRWRNNGNREWREPRELSLGKLGQRAVPLRSRICGRYFKRQDELSFGSGTGRTVIRTGWRNWGKDVEKVSYQYTYDVKRGDSGVVFNGIEETVEMVR